MKTLKLKKFNSLNWLLPLALLLGAAWLCQPQTTVRAQRAVTTVATMNQAVAAPAREQSFSYPETWAQALTSQQGWGADHPRMLADVNGDGRQDVVGFGDDGVWFAPAINQTFSPAFVLADFGYNQSWRVSKHVRTTGDINGDKLADIIGFGEAGVYRALSTATGLAPVTFVAANFGYDQGWRVDRHARLLADVNGDGRKDIVAFGDEGVWLALATPGGYFSAPAFVLAEFGFNQGWTSALHIRTTADLNGDDRQDIIGFGNDGVWTALSTDSGFGPAQLVLADFGYNQGWQVGTNPRFVADLNGDGCQDIVGFGDDLIYRALGGPKGFGGRRGVLRELVSGSGFPWFSAPNVLTDVYPRCIGDVDGDGTQDIVAFDQAAIRVARSSDLAPVPPPNEDTLHSNSFSGPVIGAALATLPGAVINTGVIPQGELVIAPKPPCSEQKMAEVRARAGAVRHDGSFEPKFVFIDCSLTLRSSDVITKRLVFKGTRASSVTVEGNGATIDGGPGTPNYRPSYAVNMVEISSDPTSNPRHWAPPVGITLRNCKIKGSVIVYGMTGGVESTDPDYVTLTRNNAPRNIVFDRVTITGQGLPCASSSTDCNPLYLHAGVNYFQMLDSEINGSTTGLNIYLDDLSYRNTFRNNRIQAATEQREAMALDGSSENLIINNHFSGTLNHGGIYLYRNCGEGGSTRRGTPSHNTFINNFFYYDKYEGDNPAIFVASRNGKSTKTYTCPDNFFDLAQFNVVMQNQIRKRSVSDMIKVGRPDHNTPNYINHNETVAEKIERKAGSYISNGYQKDFIRDGQFINLFRNANGEPVCTGYRLTCHDGVLTQSSDSTCRPVGYTDFECQASGSNSGCQRTSFSPAGKTIIGAKAACNLEFGTVSATDLNGVSANFVKVLRASDNVSEGSCTLGGTSIRSGQAAVSGLNGLTRLSFGCRENDSNGGDCHIKGRLYYQ